MKATKVNDVTTAANKAPRRRASPILAAVHESISGLHGAGVVSLETMREFDALCLSPVVELAPAQISALRLRERVSQPVFARYLNVSKSSISRTNAGRSPSTGRPQIPRGAGTTLGEDRARGDQKNL